MANTIERLNSIRHTIEALIGSFDLCIEKFGKTKSSSSKRLLWHVRTLSLELSTKQVRLLNTLGILIRVTGINAFLQSELLPHHARELSEALDFYLNFDTTGVRDSIDRAYSGLLRFSAEIEQWRQRNVHALNLAADKLINKQFAKFIRQCSKSEAYKMIVVDIDDVCATLSKIEYLSTPPIPSNQQDTVFKASFVRIQGLRYHARQLHKAVSLPQCWQCSCKSSHNVLVSMRRDLHRSKSTDMFLRLTTAGPEDKSNRYCLQSRSLNLNLTTSSIRDMTSKEIDRRYFHPYPVRSLCGLLRGPPNKKIGEFLGYIIPSTQRNSVRHFISLEQRQTSGYIVTEAKSDDCAKSYVNLKPKFCDIGIHDRAERTTHSDEIPMALRLSLSATLACNVFYLQGTWLRKDWTCSNIVRLLESSGISEYYGQMHAVATFGSPTHPASIESLGHRPRELADNGVTNHSFTLVPLGTALFEILLGSKTMADLCSQRNWMQQALAQLYNTWGRGEGSIANAVRECMAWSGPISSDGFDDNDFALSAFEKVIWPIVSHLEHFHGRSLSSKEPDSRNYGPAELSGNSRAVFGDVYGGLHYHLA